MKGNDIDRERCINPSCNGKMEMWGILSGRFFTLFYYCCNVCKGKTEMFEDTQSAKDYLSNKEVSDGK